MRKHIYTISLSALLLVCGFVSIMYAITAEPNVNYYGCDNGSFIEQTSQVDLDGDGKYDTYIIKWCVGVTKSYPVQYGFKGVDIDNLEDEMGPRPYDKPINKNQKRPKIVLANPVSSFKEVVYDIETGKIDFWWELKDGEEFVSINVPESSPRIAVGNSADTDNQRLAILPSPNSNNIRVNFELSQANRVTINVFNQNGSNLATLVDREESTGSHEVNLNTSNLSNGLYFIQSRIGTSVFTQKLLLSK